MQVSDDPRQQEQPADEPMAYVESALRFTGGFHCRLRHGAQHPEVGSPLYTRPQPAAQWQGLTDEEFTAIVDQAVRGMYERNPRNVAVAAAHAAEAKLREKNGGKA